MAKRRKVSKCKRKISGEECPGKYQLSYDNNAPIYTCDTCGHQNLTWKKFYEEYLQLYKQKENWEDKKNHVTCVIGFFCHMYKEFYDTEYVFVPRNPNPYGCKECKDAWSLLAAFDGNADKARRYLYWLFRKGINKNTNITSFGYVNTPGLIRKYNLYAKKKNILGRESKLPRIFIEWCAQNEEGVFNNYNLETMNDLGAMISFYEKYGTNMDDIKRVLTKAEVLGLIKNGKLNIGR